LIHADLHVHTTFSSDSTIQPKQLIEQLNAHTHVKAAAVTDHDTVRGLEAVCKLASAYSDILIIPGVEISTPEGDILILGTMELPPKPWTVRNVVDYARKGDYVSIAAHPYREYGLGELTRSSGVDAIEVLNGGSPQQANKHAQTLAHEMRLPGVAGSDAHSLQELFSVYTELQSNLDVAEIIAAIKKGRVKPVAANTSAESPARP
jgi:predicted metal-dependent phosphoesterase TrpH